MDTLMEPIAQAPGAALSANQQPSPCDKALADLVRRLADSGYDFVVPTPATHARVVARPDHQKAHTLRDVFGWSLPFEASTIDAGILALLRSADGLEALNDGRYRSRYRVARVNGLLFAHSAYPAVEKDTVFLGPDSYRFADFLKRELATDQPVANGSLVDLGTGAGVGALVASRMRPDLRITMTDVNPKALRLARINASVAGIDAQYLCTRNMDGVPAGIDVVIANPPYIIDATQRAYRDGGGMYGGQVAYDMAAAAIDCLAPGGRMLLYTGAAIVAGRDVLTGALTELAQKQGCDLQRCEIDPDVFGEELEQPGYETVERIAVVGLVIRKS